jgi:predicted nuclease of restriction endonuclease-like RecB superfamily
LSFVNLELSMAFALNDFKKTSRSAHGKRLLYPHQLRDDRYLAAISYAIDYYERMVGRPRRDMQAGTLLEFFGDPKLARGIIACLQRTYVWQQLHFSEVLDSQSFAVLQERGLDHPAALRAYLYRYVNRHHNGFLSTIGRSAVLETLCADLPLDRRTFERLLTLDAEPNAVLTKVAGTPTARDIVAGYNYHSIETALRHVSCLRLTLNGPIWALVRTVHNLSLRYGLQHTIEYGDGGLFAGTVTIEWAGKRDVLGGYNRHGRRVVRALLRLLAAHPDAPVVGEATVHLGGRAYSYQLNEAALKTLGVEAQRIGRGEEAWEAEGTINLLHAWNKAYLRGETGGWRLRRDPEPLITGDGVIVPDFLLLRGQQRAYLMIASGRAAAEALVKPLRTLGGRSLVVVATEAAYAKQLAALPAIIVPHTGEPSVPLLARALPAPTSLAWQNESAWQRLQRILNEEGFIDEARLAETLGCSLEGVASAVRGWQPEGASYLPGIGLCSNETIQEIRGLLGANSQRRAA